MDQVAPNAGADPTAMGAAALLAAQGERERLLLSREQAAADALRQAEVRSAKADAAFAKARKRRDRRRKALRQAQRDLAACQRARAAG